MFQKLKQFKDMRDQAKLIQDVLAKETAEGSAGFGKVKVVINGTQQVLSVTIDDSLMSSGEKNRLQDLVRDAVNDAITKCHKLMAEKMKGGAFGDLKLPDMGA